MSTPTWDITQALDPPVLTALPALRTHPHAAADIGWRITVAVLRARAEGTDGPIPMHRIIPFGALDGRLPDHVIAFMRRSVNVRADLAAPTPVLQDRLEYLRRVGPTLPTHTDAP